ncbi:MAG: iron-containing redox enzyme family protein [Methylococcaceae bacterium]
MKNKQEHAFDPSLNALSLKLLDVQKDSKYKDQIDCRQLFFKLNQPDSYLDCLPKAYDFISLAIRETEQIYSSCYIKHSGKDKLLLLKTLPLSPFSETLLTQANTLECLNQSAGILLTQPCWLQGVFQTFSSQSRVAIELMSIYLKLIRDGSGKPDLLMSCHSLLLASNIKIPILYSDNYSQQVKLLPEIFDFANIQLIFARFPRILFPELLGFTLAYFQMATLIEICFPSYQLADHFFKQRQLRTEQQMFPLICCISDYLDLFTDQKESLWLRLQNGLWLYHLQMQRCRDAFEHSLENSKSPNQVIAGLFQQKISAAIGHHQNVLLQEKPLELWFAGMPENSTEFLQALKQSKYVDKAVPENSLLLKLFEFKGPMFGVLDKSEIILIKDWLTNNETPAKIQLSTIKTTTQSDKKIQLIKEYKKISYKELYYRLVNVDLFPEFLPTAKNRVHKLLQGCRLFSTLPFKHYSHQQFERYIDAKYQREIEAYQPLQGKPKISKAAYVWGLEQVAPMILIDGCWLQKSLSIQNVNSDIANILFSIYCDELGNGNFDQSHPVIFQQLLDSLLIKVPSIYSPKFIKHSGFINSAFDLPVYMMGLSHFSIDFLPELLGLNMAIELSGLGKNYMRLVDEWRYWEIDPAIATIHISIDNVASGHTFLAKKAIQLYMDDVMQHTGNQKVVDLHWRRIYTGFVSLQLVGWRFKLSLPVGYLINRISK